MLYQFLLNFIDTFGFLNVFKYITFRTGLALFTSLIIVLIIGGPFINFFSNKKILNNNSEIINLIKNDLDNNDYLMIKASNATGFNMIVSKMKGLR